MTTIEEIQKASLAGNSLDFIFFWGHKTTKGEVGKQCLSQWFPSSFLVDGIEYNSAEQFMMAEKARLFHDDEGCQKIIEAHEMKLIKELGRQVKNFSEEKWLQERFKIVVRGNFAKFSQSPELAKYLTETREKILVEASPYDKVWGIGLAESDPEIDSVENWDGLNLLGFALMEVRELLVKPSRTGSILVAE